MCVSQLIKSFEPFSPELGLLSSLGDCGKLLSEHRTVVFNSLDLRKKRLSGFYSPPELVAMCTYMSARVRNRTEVIFLRRQWLGEKLTLQRILESSSCIGPRAGSVCVEEDVESLVSMAACVDGPRIDELFTSGKLRSYIVELIVLRPVLKLEHFFFRGWSNVSNSTLYHSFPSGKDSAYLSVFIFTPLHIHFDVGITDICCCGWSSTPIKLHI